MANDISVKPTPIQRNALDVATELTELHFKYLRLEDEESIKKAFLEYYSLVCHLERTRGNTPDKLKEFLPSDIKDNIY